MLGMHVRHVTLRPRYVVSWGLTLRSVTAYELDPLLRQGSRQLDQPDGRLAADGASVTYYHPYP